MFVSGIIVTKNNFKISYFFRKKLLNCRNLSDNFVFIIIMLSPILQRASAVVTFIATYVIDGRLDLKILMLVVSTCLGQFPEL